MRHIFCVLVPLGVKRFLAGKMCELLEELAEETCRLSDTLEYLLLTIARNSRSLIYKLPVKTSGFLKGYQSKNFYAKLRNFELKGSFIYNSSYSPIVPQNFYDTHTTWCMFWHILRAYFWAMGPHKKVIQRGWLSGLKIYWWLWEKKSLEIHLISRRSQLWFQPFVLHIEALKIFWGIWLKEEKEQNHTGIRDIYWDSVSIFEQMFFSVTNTVWLNTLRPFEVYNESISILIYLTHKIEREMVQIPKYICWTLHLPKYIITQWSFLSRRSLSTLNKTKISA